jgi:hypothetical protein
MSKFTFKCYLKTLTIDNFTMIKTIQIWYRDIGEDVRRMFAIYEKFREKSEIEARLN